jgi:hypothetical protein
MSCSTAQLFSCLIAELLTTCSAPALFYQSTTQPCSTVRCSPDMRNRIDDHLPSLIRWLRAAVVGPIDDHHYATPPRIEMLSGYSAVGSA